MDAESATVRLRSNRLPFGENATPSSAIVTSTTTIATWNCRRLILAGVSGWSRADADDAFLASDLLLERGDAGLHDGLTLPSPARTQSARREVIERSPTKLEKFQSKFGLTS